MAKRLFGYMGYENLSNEENFIIIDYFDGSKTNEMDKLLQSDALLSKDMRRFIADVFAGRATPGKMGRPTTTRRDKWIHKCVNELLFLGRNLTSNRNEDGAAAEVAELMGLSEDAALKAYQTIENGDQSPEKYRGYNDPRHYTRITIYDDDDQIIYDFIGDIL